MFIPCTPATYIPSGLYPPPIQLCDELHRK
jgi:hypothetical protein